MVRSYQGVGQSNQHSIRLTNCKALPLTSYPLFYRGYTLKDAAGFPRLQHPDILQGQGLIQILNFTIGANDKIKLEQAPASGIINRTYTDIMKNPQ